MLTKLIKIEDAGEHIAQGEKPYAFETSDDTTMLGPACGFGADYLRYLQTQGRYAENIEEANQIIQARGAAITGIWFVKHSSVEGD